jgi:hypothetical protein
MTTTATPRRAIGIVRVSQVNGPDGESFASPFEQRRPNPANSREAAVRR